MRDVELELFMRLSRALAPCSEHFVVIGGAAHQLFRFTELAQPVDFPVLRTLDADVAVDAKARLTVRVDERLADLGLRATPSGEDTPPATRYVLDSAPTHYVQFVTHRTGSGLGRDGRRHATKVIGGAVAERLPHVDILMRSPWKVELSRELGFPVGEERLELLIANPATFVAQKLLVLDRRDPRDAAKDLVYVHDTLLIFAPALEALADLWNDAVRPSPRMAREIGRRCRKLSERPTDDIRRAVQIFRHLGRPHVPDERGMLAVLRLGLDALFHL